MKGIFAARSLTSLSARKIAVGTTAIAKSSIIFLIALTLAPAPADVFASLTITNANPLTGQPNIISFSGTGHNPGNIACIRVSIQNSATAMSGTPSGFDGSSASISGTILSNWSGWTTTYSSGTIEAKGPARTANTGPATLVIGTITNGRQGTFHILATSFSDAGCSTTLDTIGADSVWTETTTISTTVEPALSFTITPINSGSCNAVPITGAGSTSQAIALGTVEHNTMATGGQSLGVSTNAASGYSIMAKANANLTDAGGRTIRNITFPQTSPGSFPQPGTEAFGFTTDSVLSGGSNRFQSGGPKWAALNTTEVEVARRETLGSFSNCIAFGMTIGPSTVGGHYGTSITYNLIPDYS